MKGKCSELPVARANFIGKTEYKLIKDKKHSANCVILQLRRLANGSREKDLFCSVIHLAILDAFKPSQFKVEGMIVSYRARRWLSSHDVCKEWCDLVGLDHEWMIDNISKDWKGLI